MNSSSVTYNQIICEILYMGIDNYEAGGAFDYLRETMRMRRLGVIRSA
jgi:hypothetical protein